MARSFLDPKVAAQVKQTNRQQYGQEFKDRLALGMAIGQCYKAGLTRQATFLALTGLTDEEKNQAIVRWETNRKMYGLSADWPTK